jgi:hypothetical protein
MKKLFVITSLVLMTSTAWADNEVGDASAVHTKTEMAHDVQKGQNEQYGSMMMKQPADHKDMAGDKVQQGKGEMYGSMTIPQPADHVD